MQGRSSPWLARRRARTALRIGFLGLPHDGSLAGPCQVDSQTSVELAGQGTVRLANFAEVVGPQTQEPGTLRGNRELAGDGDTHQRLGEEERADGDHAIAFAAHESVEDDVRDQVARDDLGDESPRFEFDFYRGGERGHDG